MRIGQLAHATATPVRTIRYYEAIGLLSPTERSESGYRIFADHHLQQLRFIRAARGLGLSLSQIREILEAASEQSSACTCVRESVQRNIVEIEQRIATLGEMRDALKQTLTRVGQPTERNERGTICPAIESIVPPTHSMALDSPVDWRV